MMQITTNHKIGLLHLKRKALIYLRQSSEYQVLHNKESQRLQYALADRARAMGFRRVEVIDADLGISAGRGGGIRTGFASVIASVSLGEAGIIFSREASRLSRTDKDWCHLLEVCSLFGTLIGDEEHVYDPNNIDDQLLLGIKGTMSVMELNIMKMRMQAGREAKAKRGELRSMLPPGYVWDANNKTAKDPDERVRAAISMIFVKFREIRSVRQTYLWFHHNEIELPVNKYRNHLLKLVWQLPTLPWVKEILVNPFYAGVYTWGRRQSRLVYEEGRIKKKLSGYLKPEAAKVCIRDHHEGYIDWDTYQQVQEMIRNNNMNLQHDETVGALRGGQGLLSGLLRCGICGRKMHVRYWGKSGTQGRYLCKGDFQYGGQYCLVFGGNMADKEFGKEILRVLSPLGVEASLRAAETMAAGEEEHCRALKKKMESLAYEERRAFEQYNEVDPRNRLVAGELERRWNEKIAELEQTQGRLNAATAEKYLVTEAERKELTKIGEYFPRVWESKNCSPETRKKIIRTLVREIIVTPDSENKTLNWVIHWVGGCHTTLSMPRISKASGKTSLEDVEIIRRMATRYADAVIAGVLNRLGRTTGKDKRWNEERVKSARNRLSIAGHKRSMVDPEIMTSYDAAKYCQVSPMAIRRMVKIGMLKNNQVVPLAPWEIKKADLDSELIQGVIKRLRKTGRLSIEGGCQEMQPTLFQELNE